MKNKTSCKSGFTLIELLVVVLIIGILASIALPLYQKAVDKSKATEAVVQGKGLMKAQKLHFLESGSWSTDIEELAVSAPGWTCSTSSHHCNKSGSVAGASFEIARYSSSKVYLFCKALPSNARANQLCTSVGGTLHHVHNSVNYYAILEEKLY